jgi:hypothetical protein
MTVTVTVTVTVAVTGAVVVAIAAILQRLATLRERLPAVDRLPPTS